MSASTSDSRYSRQSFIGDQEILETACIGIAGLGGGGSVTITQLAHAGFANIIGFDPNIAVQEKHLNRTLGITIADIETKLSKVQNAERIMRNLQPGASPKFFQEKWQNKAHLLERCKVIFGCLDGMSEREQLEAFCRSKNIPYVDIGLGVTAKDGEIPRLAGQVIVSMPGHACMRCISFLNDQVLAEEADEYGDAGVRPQVIWGNLVLAGTAVSLAVQIITGWAGPLHYPIYLQYDGNENYLKPHVRMAHLDLSRPCPHFEGTKIFTLPDAVITAKN